MQESAELQPAAELALRSGARVPDESEAYRKARTELLAAEIELRRQIERVAAMRRALPAGAEVPAGLRFVGESGPLAFSELFGEKETLMIYSMMFGPQRTRACPVCTSLLEAWNGAARNVQQRVALVVMARSPVERLTAYAEERGWRHLRMVSDETGDYTRRYVDAKDGDAPGLNVFTRRDGVIRHFWGGEMGEGTADPGQDPRGAPDIDPLWTMLDMTPEGRGTDWYPKLEYPGLVSLHNGAPLN